MPIAPAVLRGAVELRYVENEDIAFSALRRLGVPRSPELLITLSAAALAIVVLMAVVARRQVARGRAAGAGAGLGGGAALVARARGAEEPGALASRAGLALIVSGALGNIVDRVVRGYVVDFIHVKGWPVFNVADIAVVAGVVLIAVAHARRPQAEVLANT